MNILSSRAATASDATIVVPNPATRASRILYGADRFPSSNTTVGLGRSFAWNQWARVNGVVDEDFHVRRGKADRNRFLACAAELQHAGNALDCRVSGSRSSAP